MLRYSILITLNSKNVATKKGSNDRIEFAIKLPGKEDSIEEVVWMPIDAKFPLDVLIFRTFPL